MTFYPMREEFYDVLSNQNGSRAGGMGFVGWHRRTSGSGLRYVFQCRVESASCRISAGEGGILFFVLLSHRLFVPADTSKLLHKDDDDDHF